MGKHVGKHEKTVLIQSFVQANFNYCPLVWFFTSPQSLRKIEYIQERALRILFNDYVSETKVLLVKADKTTFLIKQHKNLAIEIFKTLMNLNPNYTKDITINTETSKNPLKRAQIISFVSYFKIRPSYFK